MGKIAKITANKPETKKDNIVSRVRKREGSKTINSSVDQVLQLQRTIGNRAVQRLIKSGVIQKKHRIDQPNAMCEKASDGYDVNRKTGTYNAYAQLNKKLISHEFVRGIQQREKQGNVLQRTVTVTDHDKIPPHLNSKDYKKNIDALGLEPDDKKMVDEFYKDVSTIPFMDKTAGEIVESLLKDLCGGGKWKVDATGGEVVASKKDFCTKDLLSSPTPVSCACLCKTTEKGYKNITLEITSGAFERGGGMATPEGGDKFKVCISAFGNPNKVRGVGDTKGTAFTKGYQYLSDPPWLILGHEMCGHVEKDLSVKALKELPHVMTETYQSSAVDIENAMRREHSTAGRNYGIRMGDFSEPGHDKHFGLLYETRTVMSVKELLKKFGIPSDKKQSVYTEGLTRDYFITCPTDPKLDPERSIPVFKGIFGFKEDLGSRYIAASCDDFKFGAGEKIYLEGVFAHKVISGETKDSIATLWQVSQRAMETANKDINALDTFKNTDPLPKDFVVLIPYNKSAKDIFFPKPIFTKEESDGYINTQGVWLVDNPSKYKTTIIRKLPKDMFVLIEDEGEDKSFNKTIDRYKWWKIRPKDTMEPGWVMQRFITKHKE